MRKEDIRTYSQIPQPPHESMAFIDDLKKPLSYAFDGPAPECMKRGVDWNIEYPGGREELETAWMSLRRVLASRKIEEKKGGYPLAFRKDSSLEKEEYLVRISAEGASVSAADADGLRRGIYFLEDRICSAEGTLEFGEWKRKPFVKHRISRCFFGPTYRPPFFIDELTNEINYYPDEYLNKLAHEGINGLWLTMYFRDLPSSVFPGRGAESEKRFAKLRQTVERCGRFGIKIYVFFSEPKLFGNSYYAVPPEEAKDHPEVMQNPHSGFYSFCTSSEAGMKYLEESVYCLFSNVAGLGGMINIMFGEDNGACVNGMIYDQSVCACPRCSKRDPGEIYAELASKMTGAMRRANPDAEFIGWFYAPGQRDDSEFMHRLEKVADKWPADSGIMFNFESGGVADQLGKGRNVFDYSLAYLGPSKLFRNVASKCAKAGAKLQVGCSHENASVPFIPVPGNLYEKYKAMHELGVYAAMQCWYFGNYPGLMNKAAGELSFEPFPKNEEEFLTALARPDWRNAAPKVVQAWKYLADGYRCFPANIAFEWYGPLHHSIAWPLHLFPVDEPISPSWILKNFPEVSGDRIGECLIYQHTFEEGLTLCREMYELWQKGTDLLESLREEFAGDPARISDINLVRAISLQMRSTLNLMRFYFLREEMFFEKKDHRDALREIVEDEIANSKIMLGLCEQDSRLGYHSEAEGYLFFPEKLTARIALLEQLLNEDFPKFKPDASWIDEYTGKNPTGPKTFCRKTGTVPDRQKLGESASWYASYDDSSLHVTVENLKEQSLIIEIEPCRLWPPVRVDFDEKGVPYFNNFIFREVPEMIHRKENGILTVTLPLAIFEGYRRKGFPMRINVAGSKDEWIPRKPWDSRLLHRDFNAASAGWLIFE